MPPQGPPPQGPPPQGPYGGPPFPAPWPPPRRSRTGLWIGLGLGALALVVAGVVVVGLVVFAGDSDDGGQAPEADPVPAEPGLFSYHPVVAMVDEGDAPSDPENLVMVDDETGDAYELGPAVLDETDLTSATPREEADLGPGIWVVELTFTDEAQEAFDQLNEQTACADDEMDKRVALVLQEELVTADPTMIECGIDLPEGTSLNGYYDEQFATEFADQLEDAAS